MQNDTANIRIIGVDPSINFTGVAIQDFVVNKSGIQNESSVTYSIITPFDIKEKHMSDNVTYMQYSKKCDNSIYFMNQLAKLETANSIIAEVFNMIDDSMYTIVGVESPPINVRGNTYRGSSIVDIITLNAILRGELVKQLNATERGEMLTINTSQIAKAIGAVGGRGKGPRIDAFLKIEKDFDVKGKIDDIADALGLLMHCKEHFKYLEELIINKAFAMQY